MLGLLDSSRDSTSRLVTPTRGLKRPTCGSLKKYLVGATDLSSRLTNIVSLSTVPWSLTIVTERLIEIDIFGRSG